MWPFLSCPSIDALQEDVDRGGERERKCDLLRGDLSEAGERQRALWLN